ncbi:MAG: ABC transporter permease [Planctomycetota bacterium]
MIWQVIEIHLRRLRHNRMEWLLAFVVPIAFFSIFALIFTRGVGSTPRVKVVLVNDCQPIESTGDDLTHTVLDLVPEKAERIMEHLRQAEGLRVMPETDEGAETMVRRGSATIAIVLTRHEDDVAARLLNDASDEVASQVVTALVTRAFMQADFPGTASEDGGTSEAASDDTASENQNAFGRFVSTLSTGEVSRTEDDAIAGANSVPFAAAGDFGRIRMPKIDVVNVLGQSKSNPVISVYAAGIAVMFLLFGATNGGGMLLEERENQTLERLLSSQMTMDHLLLGKWFYLTLLGCVQVTIMFVWAQFAFGLDLVGHLDGFLMMTVVTAAAASSFGLFLATLCQTRGQLNGLSVVLVLTMSALGGSMVPRYVMSETLREAGLWTFNAWALDGYDKVFWRDLPPSDLGPQLGVLMATAFGLLVLSRILAIRWEYS